MDFGSDGLPEKTGGIRVVADFQRILTLLRKEKKISQKQAAADLGISQALLSHYEKGIRECGLSFLVKCADYYDVSCDYLLGRSPERKGQTITVDDIPDPESAGKENTIKGSVLPVLNKKLLLNSLHILYDMLLKYDNKSLTNEVSVYMMLAVYKMFRSVFSINPNNPPWLFSLEKELYIAVSNGAMCVTEARIKALCDGGRIKNMDPVDDPYVVSITTENIAQQYPQTSSSLLNLIRNAEYKAKRFER